MKNKINKYSYTLFDVAKQYNMIDVFVEQLGTIKQIYKKEASFRLLFESKRIDEETKHAIIKKVLINFKETIVEFLCIVITHKQASCIVNIINKFLSLAKKELGANKIEVITAELLDEDTMKQLFSGLNYKIKSTVDASILGGMKIKHENKIFDNSVSCQLNQLKKTLHNM